jgi:hypothetical protein
MGKQRRDKIGGVKCTLEIAESSSRRNWKPPKNREETEWCAPKSQSEGNPRRQSRAGKYKKFRKKRMYINMLRRLIRAEGAPAVRRAPVRGRGAGLKSATYSLSSSR